METIALNIQNKNIRQKILEFLKQFKSKDLEITTINDLKDLKLLQSTRSEKSISFDEYLKNEN